MADHAFSNARTWPEIQKAHQTWVREKERLQGTCAPAHTAFPRQALIVQALMYRRMMSNCPLQGVRFVRWILLKLKTTPQRPISDG